MYSVDRYKERLSKLHDDDSLLKVYIRKDTFGKQVYRETYTIFSLLTDLGGFRTSLMTIGSAVALFIGDKVMSISMIK